MSHGDCEGQTTNTFDLILVLLLILLMIIIDTDKGPSSMVKRTKHAIYDVGRPKLSATGPDGAPIFEN